MEMGREDQHRLDAARAMSIEGQGVSSTQIPDVSASGPFSLDGGVSPREAAVIACSVVVVEHPAWCTFYLWLCPG